MSAFDPWVVSNHKLDPHSLRQHRSVFNVSNSYFGLGGTIAEDRLSAAPLTIINGVYDELDMFGTLRASNQERRWLDPEHFDSAGRSPAVANLPSPLMLQCFLNDREVTLTCGAISEFTQQLDMRCGLYGYSFVYTDPDGTAIRIAAERFASLAHPHRAYMRWAIRPMSSDAELRIRSGVDGTVRSNVTGERQFDVTGTRGGDNHACMLSARTLARGIEVELGVAHRGLDDRARLRTVIEQEQVYAEYVLQARPGEDVTLERTMVLASSEDGRHGLSCSLGEELSAAASEQFDAALTRNRQAWDSLWENSDVVITGDDRAQQYIRFSLFHLLAAGPRYSAAHTVPVKLLTGDFYQGNTFYDTDLYILPFYTFTQPELVRNFLGWRHAGLDEGRRIASRLGFEGAKLAWQAGPYGEECLGDWYRFTKTNIHITADVAFAAVQYWRATGDDAFMASIGCDLLVAGARFYASRVTPAADGKGYDIHGVTGPNEGHVGVKNNFFTNYLAQQNLRWAADVLVRADDWAAGARSRHEVNDEELTGWQRIADGITFHFDAASLRYEQHTGFYQLKEIPQRYGRDRGTWFETVFPYQALNQPDMLLAMTLMPDGFPEDVVRANWEYYKDKSMDFSSMSYAPSAVAAARMGDAARAYENFLITAGMDLDEELTGRRDTDAGLHGTAAGGAWMAAVQGFGGVNLGADGLTIDPHLPRQWRSLRFRLGLRGSWLDVEIDDTSVTVTNRADSGEIALAVHGRPLSVRAGQSERIETK